MLLEHQPWETLQLGLEEACKGLLVAAVTPPEAQSWRDTRVGGGSLVPAARWSPPFFLLFCLCGLVPCAISPHVQKRCFGWKWVYG